MTMNSILSVVFFVFTTRPSVLAREPGRRHARAGQDPGDVRRHRRFVRPAQLAHDGRAAPPLARAGRARWPRSARATPPWTCAAAPATSPSRCDGRWARRVVWSDWTSPRRCSPWRARSAAATSCGWISCAATCSTCPSPTASSTPARWASASATCPTSPGRSREMRRVVRPGGRVVCLEITRPEIIGFKQFYNLWFDTAVPLLGRLTAGDDFAYSYLPASVRRFPDPDDPAGDHGRRRIGQRRASRSWPAGSSRCTTRRCEDFGGRRRHKNACAGADARGRARPRAPCLVPVDRLPGASARTGVGRGARRPVSCCSVWARPKPGCSTSADGSRSCGWSCRRLRARPRCCSMPTTTCSRPPPSRVGRSTRGRRRSGAAGCTDAGPPTTSPGSCCTRPRWPPTEGGRRSGSRCSSRARKKPAAAWTSTSSRTPSWSTATSSSSATWATCAWANPR